MNFLSAPSVPLEGNLPMTPEVMQVAAVFTDELLDLGVLAPVPNVVKLEVVGPIFLAEERQSRLPMAGARGYEERWQEQTHCKQTCPIRSPHDIIGSLYTGGWSAVIDASKCF